MNDLQTEPPPTLTAGQERIATLTRLEQDAHRLALALHRVQPLDGGLARQPSLSYVLACDCRRAIQAEIREAQS